MMSKKIFAAKTNDANRPWLNVSVTGIVEKCVDINPPRVFFRGLVGASMKARIVILPKEKYPFKITGSRARQGKYSKFELSEQTKAGKVQYVLSVGNIRHKKKADMRISFTYIPTAR